MKKHARKKSWFDLTFDGGGKVNICTELSIG